MTAAHRVVTPFLILSSLLLIVLGKADMLMFENVRVVASDALAPILSAAARPADALANGIQHVRGLLDLYEENQRLREENSNLLQWEQVARQVARENGELRKLAHFDPKDASFAIAAAVIANSGGAFARNILVDVGTEQGVARGTAGVTGEGLVGRVAEVGKRTARILLLTDLNSRIPVMVESTHEHAVMAGDNSDQPRLLYLSANSAIKAGDRIVTEGADGVFPPGLPVGTVASLGGDAIRVEPFAELARLDYVRLVDFGLAGVLPPNAVPVAKSDKDPKAVASIRGR